MNSSTHIKNHLAGESSPYLLQHAENPVNWYPWGQEAFDRARRENKLIFLSVGYSTCHWCHVMAHESFEDPAVAALLNKNFISMKVDREERPDVDRVYMAFVQATTGQGGWPMSVWLTPDLEPVAGGTYFPPHDMGGRPGFPSVLETLAKAWQEHPDKVRQQGNRVLEALREHVAPAESPLSGVDPEISARAVREFAAVFDRANGGFGGAPKFPRPAGLTFLLHQGASGDANAREMALATLRTMADGGINDHLAGGFHRYSVDAGWHVPHFEKMLYDQAQLATLYVEAFQLTGDKRFAATARETLDYVLADLTSAEGGFYSAEDADSLVAEGRTEHAEGAFYLWTEGQIDAALGEAAAVFKRAYGVEPHGNAPQGSDPHGELGEGNILIRRADSESLAKEFGLSEADVDASLAASRTKLKALRSGRPRPHRDEKIITAWNGLMLTALSRAGRVLDEPRYLVAAERAARFLHDYLRLPDAGDLLRSYPLGKSPTRGFAEDDACLIQGLLDLYEATGTSRWLAWAIARQEQMDARFAAPVGGYFSTAGDDPSILLRIREEYDGAEPAANSVAVLNLIRLATMIRDPALADRAKRALSSFAPIISTQPTAMPLLLVAAEEERVPAVQIVIAGRPGSDSWSRLVAASFQPLLPFRVILHADGGAGQAMMARHVPEFVDFRAGESSSASLCADYVCFAPTSDPTELLERLRDPVR
jgi:uncharacterized protein YyaL (SSP411 family)